MGTESILVEMSRLEKFAQRDWLGDDSGDLYVRFFGYDGNCHVYWVLDVAAEPVDGDSWHWSYKEECWHISYCWQLDCWLGPVQAESTNYCNDPCIDLWVCYDKEGLVVYDVLGWYVDVKGNQPVYGVWDDGMWARHIGAPGVWTLIPALRIKPDGRPVWWQIQCFCPPICVFYFGDCLNIVENEIASRWAVELRKEIDKQQVMLERFLLYGDGSAIPDGVINALAGSPLASDQKWESVGDATPRHTADKPTIYILMQGEYEDRDPVAVTTDKLYAERWALLVEAADYLEFTVDADLLVLGTPPEGMFYFRIDMKRDGRTATYGPLSRPLDADGHVREEEWKLQDNWNRQTNRGRWCLTASLYAVDKADASAKVNTVRLRILEGDIPDYVQVKQG